MLCDYVTGGACGIAAEAFSKALCAGVEQLKAVYAEAEQAGISLGTYSPTIEIVSLWHILTTRLKTFDWFLGSSPRHAMSSHVSCIDVKQTDWLQRTECIQLSSDQCFVLCCLSVAIWYLKVDCSLCFAVRVAVSLPFSAPALLPICMPVRSHA